MSGFCSILIVVAASSVKASTLVRLKSAVGGKSASPYKATISSLLSFALSNGGRVKIAYHLPLVALKIGGCHRERALSAFESERFDRKPILDMKIIIITVLNNKFPGGLW